MNHCPDCGGRLEYMPAYNATRHEQGQCEHYSCLSCGGAYPVDFDFDRDAEPVRDLEFI